MFKYDPVVWPVKTCKVNCAYPNLPYRYSFKEKGVRFKVHAYIIETWLR